MENQNQKPYEKPLETIKNIENTLLMLKNKIMCLQKEEVRTAGQIEKLFTSSIPIIKNKIVQSHHIVEGQQSRNSFNNLKRGRGEVINASRIKQQNQLAKSKQQLADSKAFQSLNVKEISKKNNQKIAQIKQSFIKENRKKSQQIKNQKLKSKNRIQQFHLIKKYQMKKEREAQSIQLAKRIQKANQTMKSLLKKQAVAAEKAKSNNAILIKLKSMVGYLYKIKSQKFLQIVDKLRLQQETILDDQTLEKVLDEIQIVMEEEKKLKEQQESNLQKNKTEKKGKKGKKLNSFYQGGLASALR